MATWERTIGPAIASRENNVGVVGSQKVKEAQVGVEVMLGDGVEGFTEPKE